MIIPDPPLVDGLNPVIVPGFSRCAAYQNRKIYKYIDNKSKWVEVLMTPMGNYLTASVLRDDGKIRLIYLHKVMNECFENPGNRIPDFPNIGGVLFSGIPGFLGYGAGDNGSIWSCRSPGVRGARSAFLSEWREKKKTLDGGYYIVSIYDDNHKKMKMAVPVLVLMAFKGGESSYANQCRHLNDIKTDDRLENLAWGSALDNADDRERNGGTSKGESRPLAKLTDEIVNDILVNKFNETISQRSRRYGVSFSTMSRIVNRSTWKHVKI